MNSDAESNLRWNSRKWISGMLLAALSVATSLAFLPHQTLWNDEATQLNGIELGPVRVIPWLTDQQDYDFGVPDDRMPPLSYWGGWLWSRVFGLNERSLRCFGVACVAAATALVFFAARRCWGQSAAVVSGLMMALSPNVVMLAVEIRSYPLLILTSAGIYYCLARILTGPETGRGRWLVALTACGIAAMYSHFFGLVACGGAFLAVLYFTWASGGKLAPVVAAIAVVGISAIGILPFVTASIGLTKTEVAPEPGSKKLVDWARLIYRIFSNPAVAPSNLMVIMALLGGGLASLTAALHVIKRKPNPAAVGFAVALVSGLSVVLLVHLAQSFFTAAASHYNAWVLPAMAIFLPAALIDSRRWVRGASAAGLTLLLVASGYGDYQLSANGDFFAHTPHGPISHLIRREGLADVSVIYDGESEEIGHIYAPIRYEFGKTFPQFRLNPQSIGSAGTTVTAYPNGKSEIRLDDLKTKYLIVIRSKRLGAKELTEQVNHGIRPIGDGPLTRMLTTQKGWSRIEESTFSTFLEADVDVFEKKVPQS